MPIYEFRCVACNQRFEKLCPVGETGLNINCPGCGKQGPGRVMSSFSAKSSKNSNGGPALNNGGGCASCSSGNCSSCH